jgi:hypothetical protein
MIFILMCRLNTPAQRIQKQAISANRMSSHIGVIACLLCAAAMLGGKE